MVVALSLCVCAFYSLSRLSFLYIKHGTHHGSSLLPSSRAIRVSQYSFDDCYVCCNQCTWVSDIINSSHSPAWHMLQEWRHCYSGVYWYNEHDSEDQVKASSTSTLEHVLRRPDMPRASSCMRACHTHYFMHACMCICVCVDGHIQKQFAGTTSVVCVMQAAAASQARVRILWH